MDANGIWYVKFPTFQYNEDVIALAKDAGLRVLDARFDADDGADDVPELTVKDGSEPPAVDDEAKDSVFSIYEVVDGERADDALEIVETREEADAYVAANPDNTFEIVETD